MAPSLAFLLLVALFSCVNSYSWGGLWSGKAQSVRNLVLADIRQQINQINGDVTSKPAIKPNDEQIIANIEKLIEENEISKDKFDINAINGNWRMLWTTEKVTFQIASAGAYNEEDSSLTLLLCLITLFRKPWYSRRTDS